MSCEIDGHGTTCPYNENKTSCQIRSVESAFSGNIVSRLFCFWLLIFGYWDFLICFVGTRRAVSANFTKQKFVFVSTHIPLKTFRRNVSKIMIQQTGHRAERSCSLRPRKAVAFLTHLLRVPRSMGTGISLSADSDLEGTCPLRTPRQLRSAGAA